MENKYDISLEGESDRQYWFTEVFKINGGIDGIDDSRTLNEKRKIQEEFNKKMNEYFNPQNYM